MLRKILQISDTSYIQFNACIFYRISPERRSIDIFYKSPSQGLMSAEPLLIRQLKS